ncbi:methyltransferase domain-containing protein [Lamprobacter modestohalophilus]|uniref:methyltransferase domain-containing protein n=1 Tax=Lamprobacter modestohalophilus TaxID=1064514 RepID=UPI002ADEFC77|nr:methyltransferase [Lamprobacter modestohalophilus]MEA1052633.1 methyltransferase domain-containing protein [Lamprobacter modestohalophilus]
MNIHSTPSSTLMHWNHEATTALHEERLEAVIDAVRASGARSLLDLGCGDGDLLVRLAQEPGLERLLGLDLDARSLEQVRLRLDAIATKQSRTRSSNHPRDHSIELRHGSLCTPDAGLLGFDCALLIETIEHIDPRDLAQVEQAIFARMRPQTVIITTPNAEYNPLLEVPPNRFRHPDHRFEWDRARFQRWTRGVAQRQGYGLRQRDIGGVHPVYGGASQMALFKRC